MQEVQSILIIVLLRQKHERYFIAMTLFWNTMGYQTPFCSLFRICYMIQLQENRRNVLFMKISQVISRTTGPNIGLFGLILMHFPCWFQILIQYLTILNFFTIFWKIRCTNLNCVEELSHDTLWYMWCDQAKWAARGKYWNLHRAMWGKLLFLTGLSDL